MKRIHMALHVRGAIRQRDFSWFTKDDGTPATPDEAFDYLCDKLAAGWEKIPIGECDDFDPKTGCRGHEVKPPPPACAEDVN